jgi:ABC-2 type transport system permease protein
MRILTSHVRFGALELLRVPAFSAPIIVFPAMFFVFFGVPNADSTSEANFLMCSFAAFALLGVAFFDFGVGVAIDRDSAWTIYLRTLPVTARVQLMARTIGALAFGIGAAVPVIAMAIVLTPVQMDPSSWLRVVLVLVLGVVPFAAMGIALGYLVSPKAALPLANLLYLPLAYLGGLWTRPEKLPEAAAAVSPMWPTRQWSDLLASASASSSLPMTDVIGLALWTCIAAALARWAMRRDEGTRFR